MPTTSFIFPDEADLESAKAMTRAMSKLPNHISTILEGMNEKNYKKYIRADWDNFKIDGKFVPKLNLLITDPETGNVVKDFIMGPFKMAPSFARLTGNEESCVTPGEQSTILDRKKAEDIPKYVSSAMTEAKNRLTFRSFFDHLNNEEDPTINALKLLEKMAHIIIAEKCQEQMDGKVKVKRINELDAKNCASQPENISLLGKKFHKFVHEWDWEGRGYAQIKVDRKASKKARPGEVVGMMPTAYAKKFDPKPTEANPNPQRCIPFSFPFQVLTQEVPDNSDDEDEDPKVRAKKQVITCPDPSRPGATQKVEVVEFQTRSLPNYCRKEGTAGMLAQITRNDSIRGDIATGKHGIPIARIVCSQSEKHGGYFSAKATDLSWGLRSETAFGVRISVEGFIKPDREDENDTDSVNLALQFTRKSSTAVSKPMETIDEDTEEEEVAPAKRKRSKSSGKNQGGKNKKARAELSESVIEEDTDSEARVEDDDDDDY